MIKISQLLKLIFLLLSLSTFLDADFLLTLEQDKNAGTQNYCITDYYYKNQRIYFLQSNEKKYDSKRLKNYSSISIDAGYIFDNKNCLVSDISTQKYEAISDLDMSNYNNFSFLGISLEHFNYLMALSGVIISALFLYGLMRFI